MRHNIIIVIAILIHTGLKTSVSAQNSQHIRVGPNVMVSSQRPQDGTNYELHIAAHPTDSLVLLASGILNRTKSLEVPQEPRSYYSNDGGYSWSTNVYPEFSLERYGDPVVAFGRDGTAYFVAIGEYEGKGQVLFYRSKDGRFIDKNPKVLPWIDHEQIMVDLNPRSYYYGSIYMTGLFRHHATEDKINNQYDAHIGLLKSHDNGDTWSLVDVASNHEYIPTADGVNSSQQPIVFTNGELLVPFHAWFENGEQFYWVSRSKNGGASFDPPKKVVGKDGKAFSGIVPSYAVDISTSKFRNRLYITWVEGYDQLPNPNKDQKIDYDKSRVMLSYSEDRGETWSIPIKVSPMPQLKIMQFSPTIAVNNKGQLGINWYESMINKNKEVEVVHKFSASLDGGNSFLPEVTVTSKSTIMNDIESNILGSQTSFGMLSFYKGADAYRDYFGMATTSDGVFHPIWLDGRTGSHQLWTARITVNDTIISIDRKKMQSDLVLKDLSNKAEVISGAPREFSAEGTIEIPIRIKNISKKPIYGPIKLEIYTTYMDDKTWKVIKMKDSPTYSSADNFLLNENEKWVTELNLDYSAALGSYDYLPPNGIGDELVLKIKRSIGKKKMPAFNFKITGMVNKKDN